MFGRQISTYSWFDLLCITIGCIIIILTICKSIYWIFSNVYIFYLAIPINFRRYGSWVAITGCTDGIGKEFAEQLARMGLNLLLISRSREKLNTQAENLSKKFGIEARIVVADFSSKEESIYVSIQQAFTELDIGMLINNVGYLKMSHFAELTDKEIDDYIFINIQSTVRLTRMALPRFIDNNRGILVNLSSIYANMPLVPISAVYAGTKLFAKMFSLSLQFEYKDYSGLIIQNLAPGIVITNMSRAYTNQGVSAESFVSQALRTISRKSSTHGCLIHEIISLLIYLIPSSITAYVQYSISKAKLASHVKH